MKVFTFIEKCMQRVYDNKCKKGEEMYEKARKIDAVTLYGD